MRPLRRPSRAGRTARAVGLVVAFVAAVVGPAVVRAHKAAQQRGPWGRGVVFTLPQGQVRLQPASGVVALRSDDHTVAEELRVELVVDGVASPLRATPSSLVARTAEEVALDVPLPTASGPRVVHFVARRDEPRRALRLEASFDADVPHDLALAVHMPQRARTLFVEGVGDVGDLTSVAGRYGVLDVEPHPVALVSREDVFFRITGSGPGDLHLRAETTASARPSLAILLGDDATAVYDAVFAVAGVPARPLRGVVTGTAELTRVLGLDPAGRPLVRVALPRAGAFAVAVPAAAKAFYAVVDHTRSSDTVPWSGEGELRLDLAPGGVLVGRVLDDDTGRPLTARLIVRGRDGTPDPSFGPDYRASGAGPLLDALRGDVATALPPGRYRVLATRGLEWTVDAQDVVIDSGAKVSLDLYLRHVGATPGRLGCDLHVHARPSFDAPVTPEDRVLSLLAAGIDLAVPSEHNIVGDYGPALEALGLRGELLWVPGVEVTTYSPRLGHFGVFPYPPGPVPPFKGTTLRDVAAAARGDDPRRVFQLNHPRLPGGIGYFQLRRFEPARKVWPRNVFLGFDALEVYNGFDLGAPARVDAIVSDWFALLNRGVRWVATGSSDAHRIQYHWAGYPRTFVDLPAGAPRDAHVAVAALKAGHAVVSSGPLVDFTVAGAQPGDEVEVAGARVPLRLRVRAAPWVDVTSAEIIVDGVVAATFPIPSRPTALGREPGTLDEARARTVRLVVERELPLPPGATWVVARVRGERRYDDVLPFMPEAPMAITNPVFLRRPGAPWRAREAL